MTREHISLFDTTLRDGQQTPGVDFSLDDKLVVIDLLDKLGVDYIEGGYPGANPTDTALVQRRAENQSHLHRLRHGEAGRALRVQ